MKNRELIIALLNQIKDGEKSLLNADAELIRQAENCGFIQNFQLTPIGRNYLSNNTISCEA